MTKVSIDEKLIKDIMPAFEEFMGAKEGKTWESERKKKDIVFAKHFGRKEIANFNEQALLEWISVLWSFKSWKSKNYVLGGILESGIEEIKKGFEQLLYSDSSLPERFDGVKNNIKKVGASSISEMLIHYDCQKYPILNKRAKEGLLALGVKEDLLPSYSTGLEYASYCETVQKVYKQLSKKHDIFADLFFLNYFLYYIAT